MKKRTAVIGALVSLLPMGQALLTGTGIALTSAAVMLAIPENVKAESANSYIEQAIKKQKLGDLYGAISDVNKAIEINPRNKSAFTNRGIAKEEIGDMKGACSDWRKASFLEDEKATKALRNQC